MQTYGSLEEGMDTFFDSFTEYIDYCNDCAIPEDTIGRHLFDTRLERTKHMVSRTGRGRIQHKGGAPWSGAHTWEEALDFAYRRWDQGREYMQNYKHVLEDMLTGISFKKEYKYDYTGSGFLDIPRHLVGLPDPFLVDHEHDTPVNEKGTNIVRILYNGTAVCYATAEQMMIKGAVVTALVEALEQSNRRCEVYVAYHLRAGWSGNKTHTFMIPVKTPGQALNVETMFFALASPVMHRRFLFSLQERLIMPIRKAYGYVTGDGYGNITELPEEVTKDWDIVIPSTCMFDSGIEKQKRFILDALKKQGIEVIE